MIQHVLTLLIFTLACLYLLRMLYRTLFTQDSTGCGTCPSCEIKAAAERRQVAETQGGKV